MGGDLSETSNANRGVDYHLRALGIRRRGDWNVLASDDRCFTDGVLVVKPDWVLEHVHENRCLVIEYKNRAACPRPTAYEKLQVVVNAMTVASHLWIHERRDVRVDAVLLFGDGTRYRVSYTADDARRLKATAAAEGLAAHLRAMGQIRRRNGRIPGTAFARFLVDPSFTNPRFERAEARAAGATAHSAVLHRGAGLYHSPGA